MFRIMLAMGLIGGSFLQAADEETEKALKALQGEWKVEKVVDGGEEIPTDFVRTKTLTIKGNQIVPYDNPKDPATIKLDLTRKPAWFDLRDCANETMLGLYELKHDTLTICSAAPKEPRPKKPTSSKESKTHLIVLKRVKK